MVGGATVMVGGATVMVGGATVMVGGATVMVGGSTAHSFVLYLVFKKNKIGSTGQVCVYMTVTVDDKMH